MNLLRPFGCTVAGRLAGWLADELLCINQSVQVEPDRRRREREQLFRHVRLHVLKVGRLVDRKTIGRVRKTLISSPAEIDLSITCYKFCALSRRDRALLIVRRPIWLAMPVGGRTMNLLD